MLHACLCHAALAPLTEPTLWGRFSPCVQAAGLEAGASDSSQLGMQRQRQQDSHAPAQLLDLCRSALGVLAAPQLQPVLARFPSSWQEQLQGRACQVARAAFIALPTPSEATSPWTLQLAWVGVSALAGMMLRWLSTQGPAAATADSGSRSGDANNSSRPAQLAYPPHQLWSAAAEAAQHLPAASMPWR